MAIQERGTAAGPDEVASNGLAPELTADADQPAVPDPGQPGAPDLEQPGVAVLDPPTAELEPPGVSALDLPDAAELDLAGRGELLAEARRWRRGGGGPAPSSSGRTGRS